MADQIEVSYSDFLARTSVIRRWLMLEGEGDESGFSAEMAANVRAWALVWMCAAGESFWTHFVRASCEEFSKAPAYMQRRKIKAQAIYFIDQMFVDVTRDLDRRWEKSFSLLEKLVSQDRQNSPVSVPYDGKTLRPVHIQLFWDVFEIAGDPFPSVIHRQSLQTLADDRNSVAHGEMLPATLGRLRTKADVKASLVRLEETVERTYVSARTMLKV